MHLAYLHRQALRPVRGENLILFLRTVTKLTLGFQLQGLSIRRRL